MKTNTLGVIGLLVLAVLPLFSHYLNVNITDVVPALMAGIIGLTLILCVGTLKNNPPDESKIIQAMSQDYSYISKGQEEVGILMHQVAKSNAELMEAILKLAQK